MILGNEQPWWETTTGMVIVMGAIAAAIVSIIQSWYTGGRVTKVEEEQKEVKKEQKEVSAKVEVAQEVQKVRMDAGRLQDERLNSLEQRTAGILKDLPSNKQ